jgi:hypothetical protein
MIALKKEPKAAKCSDHHKISLIAHIAKTVAVIFGRRFERKMEDVLGEDQFGFRRGKGTGDVMLMLNAESNIRANFGHRSRIVRLLHRLAKGILPCKLEQVNVDTKGNWYRLVSKKDIQQIVRGSEFDSTTGPRGNKKCKDWKRS